MISQISAFIQANVGQAVLIDRSFSFGDGSFTQFLQTPQPIVLAPLSSQTINLCGITTSKFIMLQTDLPIDITIVTPIGVSSLPTPATFRVKMGILLTADITSITIFNPNGGPPNANISITALGV